MQDRIFFQDLFFCSQKQENLLMQHMMHFASTLSLLLALITSLSASPISPRQGHPGDALVRTVYQFPNETWVENLAVRANGKILVTLISAPEVWEVDPFATPTTAELVYRFPDAISLLGIAEYAPDVFAVNVGNWSDVTSTFQAGSWSVWSLDMGGRNADSGWSHGAQPRCEAHKITDMPSALFLNGMAALPANPSTLLVVDAGAGTIYRLDTVTGAHSIAINNPYLKPNATFPVILGVNAVHFQPGINDYVYFTNTFKSPAFARIPIHPTDGTQIGPVEVVVDSVADLEGAPDDFTFNAGGNAAYIANGAFDGLLKVDVPSGTTEVVIGGTDRSKIVGQTACHFGRTEEDLKKGTLYITNTGGIAVPPPRGIVGGSVFALDTALL